MLNSVIVNDDSECTGYSAMHILKRTDYSEIQYLCKYYSEIQY